MEMILLSNKRNAGHSCEHLQNVEHLQNDCVYIEKLEM